MTNFHNRSNEELIAEVEGLKAEGLHLFASVCERLTELAKRGCKHPLHRHNQFRHHADVTNGKLIPAIVVMFDGGKQHMDCFRGRPEDVQRTVAAGREFDVAFLMNDGPVLERKLSAGRMTLKTLQTLFPAGKAPRTVSEQRVFLQGAAKAKPPPRPRVYGEVGTGRIIIAANAATLDEIKAALAELGFNVVPKEK